MKVPFIIMEHLNYISQDTTARDLAQYEEMQRSFVDSTGPGIDGHIIDLNDLNDEEQMALLINCKFENVAQFEQSDWDVAGATDTIGDMEMEIEFDESTPALCASINLSINWLKSEN